MTTIFFFYGLAFFILGFSILLYPKKDSRFMLANNLWLIAAFGISHGINEWIDMFKFINKPIDIIPLKIAGMIIMPGSFLFLIYFGVIVITEHKKKLAILKFLPLILLISWAVIITVSNQQLLMWDVWSRYLLGTPGTFLTAYALFLQVTEYKKVKQSRTVGNLYIALISFAFYGFFSGIVVPRAEFIPASLLNYTLFSDTIGIPVQAFRTLCAVVVAYSLIQVLKIFDWETKSKIKDLLEKTLDSKNKLADAKAYTDNIIESMLDTLVVVDFVVDHNFRIRLANKATLTLLGYTKDELIGKSALSIFPKDEQPKQMFDNIIEKDLVLGEEKDYLTRGGSKIPMLFSASVMRRSTGEPHGFIFAASDISKLKQTEMELRDKEIFSSSIINNMADMLIVINADDYKIVTANNAFLEHEGLLLQEVIGKTCYAVTHNQSFPCCQPEEVCPLVDAVKKEKAITEVHTHHDKKGDAYYAEVTAIPFYSEKAKSTLVLHISKDITERNRMEEIIKESEEKFRSISTSANDGIIMMDNDGRVTYWNDAAEKIFGYSRDTVVGKAVSGLIVPERMREAHFNGIEKFKDTGQGPVIGKTVELSAIRMDGVEFPISISLASVKIKGKWNAVAIIRDITERKRIEHELQVSHKMMSVGRLSASVFHEILNPVNIISAHTQLLLMEAEKGSKTEEDLSSIQGEVARIVDITENLLKFSKDVGSDVEQVEINDLLENVLSLLRTELDSNSIKLVLKLEDELPDVALHGSELRQAFLNIIYNTIEAMPDGGTLTITTQCVQEKGLPLVNIRFIDTGCGIAKEDIDKVFEPFFSTKKEIKGVGLGLSSSYAIINGYGGRLSVESEEGKGTTVIAYVPVGT